MSAGNGLAAVVFDCDGVLVNSEELAWEAWTEALREHGYETGTDEFHSRIGVSRAENLAWYAERAGIADPARTTRSGSRPWPARPARSSYHSHSTRLAARGRQPGDAQIAVCRQRERPFQT